jgi:hypothetical protein
MAGIYKTDRERVADILAANAHTGFRFRLASGRKLVPHANSPYEREIAEEAKSEAGARLAIDKAMKG